MVVTHSSTNRGRRDLTTVNEPLSYIALVATANLKSNTSEAYIKHTRRCLFAKSANNVEWAYYKKSSYVGGGTICGRYSQRIMRKAKSLLRSIVTPTQIQLRATHIPIVTRKQASVLHKTTWRNWRMKWDERWINSMKWSWFKVPVKVEQINEYLFSDTVQSQ